MNKRRKDKDVNEEINEVEENELENKEENPNLGLFEEIENLKKEVEMWKDKAYRLVADTDNLRKSYEKDHANLLKYRSMGFVERLLPVLDSFHISLMVKPTDPALANYVKGFEMIYRQMKQALELEGVTEIAPKVGDDFNADNMQAIDVKDGEEDNKVIQVYQNGYILKDRLVRPAMVVVSKVPTKNEDEVKDDSNESVIN